MIRSPIRIPDHVFTPLSIAEACPGALLVASRYVCLATMIGEPGFEAQAGRIIVSVIAAYALRLNSLAGTEGSTVSSLICDRWLMLGLDTLSISRCLNH